MAYVKATQLVERIGKFLLEDVWEAGTGSDSRLRRGLVVVTRVAFIATEGFRKNLCMLRASALTYSSMLALVPVLALAFALLRGLGWKGERLEAVLLGKATVLSPEAIKLVVSYIDKTSLTGVGLVGGAALLFTFVSVMANIETSFNAIWGGVPARTVPRKIGDYLGVMVMAPLLLALATSLTAGLASNSLVEWISGVSYVGTTARRAMGYGAYGTVWVLFAFLYMFMPNTKVRLVPALCGGVLAGSVWQITQWGYIKFQIGTAKYNAIYGALAQLPILMVWIYLSWVVVLFGAEIAFAVQTLGHYSRRRRSSGHGPAMREVLGLRMLAHLARVSQGHHGAPTPESLAEEFDAPVETVRAVLDRFVHAGLVKFAAPTGEECFLAYAPDTVQVDSVIDILREADEVASQLGEGSTRDAVARLVEALAKGRREALAAATVKDLIG